ncbi:MAG: acyl-CoA dehydrogenase family protein [Myxococcota bacterium]
MQDFMYEEEHRAFRDAFAAFVEREIVPREEAWREAGKVDREVWRAAGAGGFLALSVPEQYGGASQTDFRFNVIVSEVLARCQVSSVGFNIHTDIVVPLLAGIGNDEQKGRWLPNCVTGEAITCIGMTEPKAGSDLQGIHTVAEKQPDGSFILNGRKTLISGGALANLCVIACKAAADGDHQSMSLLVVEDGMEGFSHDRELKKIGLNGLDMAELTFENVRVPAENLLGEEGMGFLYLVRGLAQERLIIGLQSLAMAEAALEETVAHCQERTAFGRPIGKFQNSRFKLAEMFTEITIGRTFVDQCIMEHNEGKLTAEKASMAKYWLSELLGRVVDQCLQLHGGHGYIADSPIAKMYTDARASRIYGGTNEIMREIIGRSMGF